MRGLILKQITYTYSESIKESLLKNYYQKISKKALEIEKLEFFAFLLVTADVLLAIKA